METIIEQITFFVTNTIGAYSYWATGLLMAIESANVPIPSEIILPFSGFLVSQSGFSFWGMVLAGSIGGTLGSVLSYTLGKYGGQPFFKKYGKYFFLHKKELETSEKWFKKYGDTIAFTSRLLPVVRTFISFPAGMHEIRFLTFTAYTFTGSLLWSILLVWLGVTAGENWGAIRHYMEPISYVVITILIIALLWFISKKIGSRHKDLGAHK